MKALLNEQYRPKKFEEVLGMGNDFRKLNLKENLPHFLFTGSPGTGKTTVAKIIINELGADNIILNASDERGIDIIRDKIKSFASTQSRNGGLKIIFLDEADSLTMDSQTCLRNIMETYSSNCRFIMTCNYENKIIDAIKSRCVKLTFGNIEREEIFNRIRDICIKENISYEDTAIDKILDRTHNDVRKAINKIEEMRNGVLLANIKEEIDLAREVFALLKSKKFVDAKQKLLNAHVDYEQFLKDFYIVVFNSNEKPEFKKYVIFEIVECYKYLGIVAWKEIIVEYMMLKVMDRC